MHERNTNRPRLKFIFTCLIFVLIILALRLFYIQVIQFGRFHNIASQQHDLIIEAQPKRGAILDAKKRPLAICTNLDSLYANPHIIKNKKKTAARLAPILNIPKEDVLEKISQDKGFVWLARKITPQVSAKVKALRIEGLDFIKESKRLYPNNTLASHMIGFAGTDNKGLEGLELYYDKYLKGASGWIYSQRDAKGRGIGLFENKFIPAVDGYDLVLSIDEVIQHIAEDELDKAYKKYRAAGASIVVMEPDTGYILALANRPTYDLNKFSGANTQNRRNRAVCDVFEPGSSFKIVTASAVLEENLVDLDDEFYCENGTFTIGKRVLHDHRPHGTLSFKEVIELSSNIGTVKAAMKLKEEPLYNYIRNFGFGDTTKVDLPGEVGGMVRPLNQWSRVAITSVPMGQGVAVTALQLACAMSAIANGGFLVRPIVVREIVDNKGEVIKEFKPHYVRRVLSEDTCMKMKDVLSGVVDTGTGTAAKLTEYRAAGKTGTAQKVDPNGTYSHSNFVASFIGFAPAAKPEIVVVVIVDQPRSMYYGGVVCAPVFKQVAEKVLRYMEIPSENKI